MPQKKILVIEDESDIATTLELVLAMENLDVRLSFNGKEALDALESGYKPDLIVSDIMMPIMNGYEFIHEFRKDSRFKTIPIVLTSAAKLDESRLPQGSWQGFIKKPFDLDVLIKEVSNHV